MLEDFCYLKSISGDVQLKMIIFSLSVLYFCGGWKDIDVMVYLDFSDYFDDLVIIWCDVICVFYDVGCCYLQLDDIVWVYLCFDVQCQQVCECGEDLDVLVCIYVWVLNQVLEGKLVDLMVGLYVCWGNFCLIWILEGGYELVVEVLFGGVNVDVFFLEYDNDCFGDFVLLCFICFGYQQVVFGLIIIKNGELENLQGVKV